MTNDEIRYEIERLEGQESIIFIVIPILIFVLFAYGDFTSSVPIIFKLQESIQTYLSITGGIISAIIGLAIPISLNVIQMIQAKYRTSRLTKEFVKEPIYRIQIWAISLNVAVIVMASLFNIQYLWVVCVVLFTFSFATFLFFIRMILRYVTDLDVHLAEKYQRSMIKFLRDGRD